MSFIIQDYNEIVENHSCDVWANVFSVPRSLVCNEFDENKVEEPQSTQIGPPRR